MRSLFKSNSLVRAPRARQVCVCAEHTVNLRFSIKQKLEYGA